MNYTYPHVKMMLPIQINLPVIESKFYQNIVTQHVSMAKHSFLGTNIFVKQLYR